MLLRIFSGQHGTQGKPLARMGIVGDGDAVGLRIIAHGMNTGHLSTAQRIDAERCRIVRLILLTLYPTGLAIQILQDISSPFIQLVLRSRFSRIPSASVMAVPLGASILWIW